MLFWIDDGTGAPTPTGVTFAYPTILPIDCVIQVFRVRPGDKGLLGGTGEHLRGTWGRS